MKKLLQINTVVNTGSTGRIAEGIGLQAMNNGWDSYVAYGRYGNPSSSNVIKIGTKWDNYRNVINTRLTDKHGLGSISATRRLVYEVKKLNPSIIHLHNIHGYYLNYEILFAYLAVAEIPVVWTLHDCWPFTGHCAHFEFARCTKWKQICHHCPEIHSYPKSYLDNSTQNYRRKRQAFTSPKDMTLIPVSKWLEGTVKQSFLKKYKTRQIYTGIDLKAYYPKRENTITEKYNINQKFYLGVASTWTKRKGLLDYHKLANLLTSEEKLILVGLSDKQISKLPEKIVGINRTENIDELVELYRASTAFINLTLEDTFPTTNIEALACGTPVITYATGGSPEAIDENTGWVVPKGDLKGIRMAMDECLKKDRVALGQACRQRAEQYFDKNARFAEYLTLYENLLINA